MKEGRRLADRFLILKTIGAGGATEISLAQDVELGELVALRVLTAPFADRWEYLRDACRDARNLSHPHIARVFDFYRSDGTPFICREYVEGASIVDLANRSDAEDCVVFAAVAAALEFAHSQGVVHGDLKASKILRDVRGNVRVVDFRIAAALRAVTPQTAGRSRANPQIRMGESAVAADDIYALGVLISERISGASAPRELLELVRAMTAEQRDARIRDLSEIREALTAFASGGTRPPGPPSSRTPILRPPAASAIRSGAAPEREGSATSSRNLQYAVAAAVLSLAALVVFVALPRWVQSPGAPGNSPEVLETGDAGTITPPRETRIANRSSAESVLARLLPLREQLEGSAVERWAGTDYAGAREIENRGDAAFVEGDYAAAQMHYGEALEIFEALAQRRGDEFAANLEAGEAALAAHDPPRAMEAFELAIAIEPDSAAAREGAQRAGNLGAVMAHMSAGDEFEANDALDSARDEYATAVEIDPQYAPAREALERTEAAQADRDYESNLSLALVSMANGKLGVARGHFERARALRPGSPEVQDGLRQLHQIESSRAIASLRERAEAAENAENWSEAATLYQKIVDTQDHLPFAEKGLQRSRELARISERISKLLDDPTQLFKPEMLEEAGDLVELGRSEAAGRPKLGSQVRNLEIAVQLASTPIPVIFESDTLTEVVIRGVGSIGNFSRRDVPLRPGRYVVIGRRNGYRDTRSEVSVIPGEQQPVVEVRCIEKI